ETATCTQFLGQEKGQELLQQGLPEGWYLETDFIRQYPLGPGAAHVLGYLGELSQTELKDDYYSLRNYQPGDKVGRMGAEEVFEDRLRGRDGGELVEVDARGKILRSLGRQEDTPGEDISLALDAGLSRVASTVFPPGEKGAIIVTKPSTGEILALYSSPSFSPDAFSLGMSTAQYQALIDNSDKPMFNRAIGGVYPPGSTFKIVTALAALEEGAVRPETIVDDVGVITIGPFTFPNWYFAQYGKTEGNVDIVKAIQRSNDIFFYKAAEWVGITKLASWAKRIGIGKPLGIEISGEASGLMPDPSWKRQEFTSPADKLAHNDEWYLGDTYHVAIGQGYVLTTPLQVNAWTNVIASGGKFCEPTIQKITNAKTQAQNCKSLGIKPEAIDLITKGMIAACEPGGTGWPLFNFQISKSDQSEQLKTASPSAAQPVKYFSVPVACKTGTAEFGDPKNRTHAWFTAFAPVRKTDMPAGEITQSLISGDPEISVTVLVEGAGEGSNVAAPVAKKILEEWFRR
ncbi:hypothetical protein HY031_01805, partial [Candidatus Gottesmanbacteria bacterium]|nr:hypothetical protein [Candidatus Gottesmanbacteria bacterium]